MYGKTRVLQNWKPLHLSKFLKHSLAQEVSKLIGNFHCQFWTVREPGHKNPETNTRWHRDGPEDIHSIVWSNVRPTEFQNGPVFNDGDIILVRNLDFLHRSPSDTTDRWFVQFYGIAPAKNIQFGKYFK